MLNESSTSIAEAPPSITEGGVIALGLFLGARVAASEALIEFSAGVKGPWVAALAERALLCWQEAWTTARGAKEPALSAALHTAYQNAIGWLRTEWEPHYRALRKRDAKAAGHTLAALSSLQDDTPSFSSSSTSIGRDLESLRLSIERSLGETLSGLDKGFARFVQQHLLDAWALHLCQLLRSEEEGARAWRALQKLSHASLTHGAARIDREAPEAQRVQEWLSRWEESLLKLPLAQRDPTGLQLLDLCIEKCIRRIEEVESSQEVEENKDLLHLQASRHGNVVTLTGLSHLAVIEEPELHVEIIETSPYRGLRPFSSDESHLFYGRERFISRLWNRFHDLQDEGDNGGRKIRVLTLFGASGSGKSSLIRAGLLPELARKSWRGIQKAHVVIVRPGEHPIASLATMLVRSTPNEGNEPQRIQQIDAELRRISADASSQALMKVIRSLKYTPERPLVLFIDQFEEMFLRCGDPLERERFVDLLLAAASEREPIVTVILTLSPEAFEDSFSHQLLSRVICEEGIQLPVMSEVELRQALIAPAAHFGNHFGDALTEKILLEARVLNFNLAALQVGLASLWRHSRDEVELETKGVKVGWLKAIAARELNARLEELDEGTKRLIRSVLDTLIDEAEGRIFCRKVWLKDLSLTKDERELLLKSLTHLSPPSTPLFRFTEERGDIGIELLHVTLVKLWDELTSLSESDLKQRRDELTHFLDAVKQWERGGRKRRDLVDPRELESLISSVEETGRTFSQLQLRFIDACYKDARSRIFRQRLSTILLVILTFAALGYVAFMQYQMTEEQRDVSFERKGLAFNEIVEGDLLLSHNNLVEALSKYRTSLNTAQDLTQAYPDNVQYRRDYALSLGKVGVALAKLGDEEAALSSLEEAKNLLDQLSASNTEDSSAQQALVWVVEQLDALSPPPPPQDAVAGAKKPIKASKLL